MRFDYKVIQPATIKNLSVDVVVLLIRNLQPISVDVEGIGVLHKELAHPQQACFWPRLVTKFGLNLVPDLRQLLVAAQFFAGNLGHDLFRCHAETKVGSFTVLEAEKIVTHQGPSATGLPNLARLQRRKMELLSDLVHLLAYYGND